LVRTLQYEPHGPIKAQCVADFISNLHAIHVPEED